MQKRQGYKLFLENNSMKIDEKDIELLEILRKDCSLTKKKMARKTGLPLTTVHNRVARLERDGYLQGYRARIGWKKLGYGISAIISMSVDYKTKNYSQEETAKRIMGLEGADSVSIVAGGTDIIARVRAKDTDELNDFITKKLRKIEGIDKTTTFVILKEFE